MRADAAQCASAMKEMYDAELAAGTNLQTAATITTAIVMIKYPAF